MGYGDLSAIRRIDLDDLLDPASDVAGEKVLDKRQGHGCFLPQKILGR
jgi:hypothetical protein